MRPDQLKRNKSETRREKEQTQKGRKQLGLKNGKEKGGKGRRRAHLAVDVFDGTAAVD
jgi:hypothetical protein